MCVAKGTKEGKTFLKKIFVCRALLLKVCANKSVRYKKKERYHGYKAISLD